MNQLLSDCILLILSRSEVEGVLNEKKKGNLNRLDRLVGVTADKQRTNTSTRTLLKSRKKLLSLKEQMTTLSDERRESFMDCNDSFSMAPWCAFNRRDGMVCLGNETNILNGQQTLHFLFWVPLMDNTDILNPSRPHHLTPSPPSCNSQSRVAPPPRSPSQKPYPLPPSEMSRGEL